MFDFLNPFFKTMKNWMKVGQNKKYTKSDIFENIRGRKISLPNELEKGQDWLESSVLDYIENLLECRINKYSFILYKNWKIGICFEEVDDLDKNIYEELLSLTEFNITDDKFVILFD